MSQVHVNKIVYISSLLPRMASSGSVSYNQHRQGNFNCPKYPDRWTDYSKLGKKIEGTQLFALKVPLRDEYFSAKDREQDRFTPSNVVQLVPNLGMIIDLTFTTKYYRPNEFKHQNIHYEKLATQGHVVPETSLVNRFIELISSWQANEKNKDKLIGVHCTHGVNRTGYFVCAYMIHVHKFDPKAAIKAFNEARSHDIERENYIQSLFTLKPHSNLTRIPDEKEDILNDRNSRWNGRHTGEDFDRRQIESDYMRRELRYRDGHDRRKERSPLDQYGRTYDSYERQSSRNQIGRNYEFSGTRSSVDQFGRTIRSRESHSPRGQIGRTYGSSSSRSSVDQFGRTIRSNESHSPRNQFGRTYESSSSRSSGDGFESYNKRANNYKNNSQGSSVSKYRWVKPGNPTPDPNSTDE